MIGYIWIHNGLFELMVSLVLILSLMIGTSMIGFKVLDRFTEDLWPPYAPNGIDYCSSKKEQPPIQKKGKKMFVRRYEEGPRGFKVIFEEVISRGVIGYSYTGGYAQAPEGTKYVYLDEKKEWGYTEPEPKPKVTMICSKGMMDKAREILQAQG